MGRRCENRKLTKRLASDIRAVRRQRAGVSSGGFDEAPFPPTSIEEPVLQPGSVSSSEGSTVDVVPMLERKVVSNLEVARWYV